jgi:hypothetical protein
MVIAVAAIIALIAVWIIVQAVARRQSPRRSRDADVLACTTCGAHGWCRCGLDQVLAREREHSNPEKETEKPIDSPSQSGSNAARSKR